MGCKMIALATSLGTGCRQMQGRKQTYGATSVNSRKLSGGHVRSSVWTCGIGGVAREDESKAWIWEGHRGRR